MFAELPTYIPKADEFDSSIFDCMFEAFPSFCDPAEEKFLSSVKGFELLLNPESVTTHLTWCLSQKSKFNTPLARGEEIDQAITPDLTNPNQTRYLKEAFVIGRDRLRGTLPLTEKEYKTSIKNLKNNPELFRAIITLKGFMSDYLSCLSEKAQESMLFEQDSSRFVQRSFLNSLSALRNGLNTGFLVEFGAIVGLNTQAREVNFSSLLHNFFAAPSAFKTVSIQGEGLATHTCPFHSAATNILTKDFSTAGKEKLSKRAGGILVDILKQYQALESSPSSVNNDPNL